MHLSKTSKCLLTPAFWQPPLPSKIKVNWDAAVNKKHGRRGVGIVTRDSKGFILATRSTTQRIVLEPIVAEALAALHAVILSKEIGFSDIILEGDALQIIQEINSERPNLSKFNWPFRGE